MDHEEDRWVDAPESGCRKRKLISYSRHAVVIRLPLIMRARWRTRRFERAREGCDWREGIVKTWPVNLFFPRSFSFFLSSLFFFFFKREPSVAWPTLANEINIITTRCLGFYTCAEREQDREEREETKILFLVRRDTRGTWFLKLIMQLPWEVDPRSSNHELSSSLRLTSLFKVLITIRLSG